MKELIIELSHNCNLACTMCGFGGKKISADRFMNWNTLNKVLQSIPTTPECIRLNGRGESTIHPEFVSMLQKVRQTYPTSKINLFTNLSITNDHVLQALIESDAQLFISLDSPYANELESIRKGANFFIIQKNMCTLKSLMCRPYIVFTMQEANLHRLVDMAKFSIEYNMNIIFNTVRRDEGIEPFIYMVKEKRAQLVEAYQNVSKLFKESHLKCLLPHSIHGIPITEQSTKQTFGEKNLCPALHEELCILHNGTVTPCNMFNPYEFGNILKDDLSAILNSEKREWFLKNNKSHYYCANCSCLGGTA